MNWYAAWGHTEFVLCLGYKGECIKQYFLGYNEALSNDFVLRTAAETSRSLQATSRTGRSRSSIPVAVDPGRAAACGRASSRWRRVLPRHLRRRADRRASSGHDRPTQVVGEERNISVGRPMFNAHVVQADHDGTVLSIDDIQRSRRLDQRRLLRLAAQRPRLHQSWRGARRRAVQALIGENELLAYRYEGFWEPMDTIKDKQRLDALFESGNPPWRTHLDATVPR